MNKKRERLGVIYDILKIVRDHNNSIKPTPLLRYSNLSSQRFAEYLKELLDKEFLREMKGKDGKKYYSLTDNGFRYLEQYKVIMGFIVDFNL